MTRKEEETITIDVGPLALNVSGRLTDQQMFDKVAKHLLTQNARSFEMVEDGEQVCVYRSDKTNEGRKCAIGILIPDEEYDPKLEGQTVMTSYSVRKAAGIGPDQIGLASALQFVHDKIPVKRWPVALRELALKHGLNSKVVDACTWRAK